MILRDLLSSILDLSHRLYLSGNPHFRRPVQVELAMGALSDPLPIQGAKNELSDIK